MQRKIVVIMPFKYSQHIGGAEVQAYLLSREWSKTCRVYYLYEDKEGRRKPYREGWVTFLPLKLRKYVDVINIFSICRLLLRLRPDIIYNRYTSSYTFISLFAKYFLRIPFIWVCTDRNIARGHSFIRWLPEIFKQNKNVIKLAWIALRAVIIDLLAEIGQRQATAVVCLEEAERDAILTRRDVPLIRIIAVGHEIAPRDLAVRKRNTVLWVSNIGIHKNPEDFIWLAESLKDQNLRFMLVGDHSDNKRKGEVREMCERANVELYTGLKYFEVEKCYDQASLFVDTSKLMGGGIGNTQTQALKRGIPVISLYKNINIAAGQEISMFCGTKVAVRESVLRIIEDANLYEDYSKKGYRYAEKHLDIRSSAKQYLCLFEEVMDKNARST